MDVKRVESIAVPPLLAAVGGGFLGYMIPRMTKNGKLTDEFVNSAANTLQAEDANIAKEAKSLDELTFEPSKEEIQKIVGDKSIKEREKALKNLTEDAKNTMSEEIDALKAQIDKLKNDALKRDTEKLEKFVTKNAKTFGIKPTDGQSLEDAVKEYLKDKDVKQIKRTFLASKQSKPAGKTGYKKLIKERFSQVFDKDKKAFKKDAEKEVVKMFKKAARNMKLKSAAKLGAITGFIALISSTSAAIANRISNR